MRTLRLLAALLAAHAALLAHPATAATTPGPSAERSVADSPAYNELIAQITHTEQTREFKAQITYATQALALARRAGDQARERLMLATLAQAHEQLGRYPEALRFYQAARERYRTSSEYSGKEVAGDLADLAHIYYLMGDYTNAHALFARCMATTNNHPNQIDALTAQGVELHLAMGNAARALPLANRGIVNARRHFEAGNTGHAHSLNNVVMVGIATGQLGAVLPLAQQSLVLAEQEAKNVQLTGNYPPVAQSLHLLAAVHSGLKQHPQALALHQRSLALREKLYVPEHPLIAQTLDALAQTHLALGNPAAALPLAQRALQSCEKMLGARHPDVAQSLHTLATIAHAQAELSEAAALAQRALNLREKVLGQNHPLVAQSVDFLAALPTATRSQTQRATKLNAALRERAPRESVLQATAALALKPL